MTVKWNKSKNGSVKSKNGRFEVVRLGVGSRPSGFAVFADGKAISSPGEHRLQRTAKAQAERWAASHPFFRVEEWDKEPVETSDLDPDLREKVGDLKPGFCRKVEFKGRLLLVSLV